MPLRLTTEELDRVKCRIRPFPLDPTVTPTETCTFENIPDSVLLEAPPQLIVHMQRTASQGGMQVVSPRQTPMSCLMTRINTERRVLGDHIVGSTAAVDDEWPTMDDADFSMLLPDEPLPQKTIEPAIRTRTRTQSLTTATHMLSDPILSCLVKGRAVADILDRPDVQGDSRALLSLLADAWGVEESHLSDLDAFSLGYEGELLRHAIRVDDVYPTIHAPVHRRLSISVGTNEITRETLPADTALDWRRMRVYCEAVFMICTSIEGLSLKAIRASPPPGDMGAPGNRKNIMAFLPASCSAWCHSSDTFSIAPVIERRAERQRAIPPEVFSALTRYIGVVKPMSFAMAMGITAKAKTTHLVQVDMPPDETIKSSYHMLSRATVTQGARGRTAAATVRNYIFEVIEAMDPEDALRISRYIQIAKKEVNTHLDLQEVPDEMIDELSIKFLTMGDKIRLKVVAEATLRGHTAKEWWDDITSQTAARYKSMAEGTMGWAKVAMYLLFRQPTDKWRKLCSAINFETMRSAVQKSVGGVALPPVEGSPERIEAAARYVSKTISKTYAGHYLGVHDVGRAIASYMEKKGKTRSAEVIKQASYLWALRARVFRATNITLVDPSVERRSMNHYLAKGKTVSINLAPAPYRMYNAYRIGVMQSDIIPKRVHSLLPVMNSGRISRVFTEMKTPILPARESELTKYLLKPSLLGADMEKAWRELTDDMAYVLETYETRPGVKRAPMVSVEESPEFDLFVPTRPEKRSTGKFGYFDITANLDGDAMDYIDRMMDEIGEDRAEAIMEEEFTDHKALLVRLLGEVEIVEASSSGNIETVR